jgi:hypothetical protein
LVLAKRLEKLGLVVWIEDLGLSTMCPFDMKPCRHTSGWVKPPSPPLRDDDVMDGIVVDGVCKILELDQDTFERTGKVIVCSRFVDLVKLVKNSC